MARIGIRIANAVGLSLFGEPLSPVQFPCAEWELRGPQIAIDGETETLVLTIRDIRYRRLRGQLSIKLIAGRTTIHWRTRLSGGEFVADRPILISGEFLRGPLVLGRLCCNNEETKLIQSFLLRQRPSGSGDADPLFATSPRSPAGSPRGGEAALSAFKQDCRWGATTTQLC